MGIVTRRNVLSCDAPRLMDASSTLGLICPMMAVLDRIVYGMRRMESDITMMSTVPPSSANTFAVSVSVQPGTAFPL